MQNQVPTRAAIDIGSNTLHIVVAQASPDDLHILADEVDMVRIGESVNATGEISPQKREQTFAVLHKYLDLAASHHAQPVLAVATEAIRKAKNGADFLAELQRETGLAVQLIEGEVEAVLSFYGATYELFLEPDAPSRVAVLDLGGGSAELVVAKRHEITWRTSLPIGSGWLHDRYLSSNPPTVDELDTARAFLKTFLDGLRVKSFPSALIVTGGSANSLLYLARSAFSLPAGETRLKRDDLVRCEGLLTALSAEEVAQRYEQPLSRAKILPAGAFMIRMVMERFQLQEIRVSPHGIREGALLAYARAGEQWLERVQQSVDGFSGAPSIQVDYKEDEPFASSGQRLVLERVRKMLEWRDEVLKHNDIEAVHKMRVATRRLRAVLDAYEILCDAKTFKRIYRRVKQIADILGMARDTDVMIDGLQQQLAQVSPEEQAGLHWLIARLDEYRQMHQDELEEFFEDFDEDAFKKRIESALFRVKEVK